VTFCRIKEATNIEEFFLEITVGEPGSYCIKSLSPEEFVIEIIMYAPSKEYYWEITIDK
jgi:hypothetical protein